MQKSLLLLVGTMLTAAGSCANNPKPMGDIYKTSMGAAGVYVVGHASLIVSIGGKVIHIDPYSAQGDYAALPKADLLLITHEHSDHFDMDAIGKIDQPSMQVIASKAVAEQFPRAKPMSNGDKITWNGIGIEALPAYNIAHKRPDGAPYHPKGRGNGYLLTIGNFKLYVGGDTEDIEEFNDLKARQIDVAFLPKNLPYTMTEAMFVRAAKMIAPKVVYPYHYFELDKAAQLRADLAASGITMKVFKK